MQRSVEGDALSKSENVMIGYRRRKKWTKIFALIFIIAFALWVQHVPAQSHGMTHLKEFYQESCARCHGEDGSAVSAEGKKLSGQDLTDQDWQRNTEDEKMVKIILKGKFFGLAMPKYESRLTEEEARWIVTDIIRNMKKGQVIGPKIEDRTRSE